MSHLGLSVFLKLLIFLMLRPVTRLVNKTIPFAGFFPDYFLLASASTLEELLVFWRCLYIRVPQAVDFNHLNNKNDFQWCRKGSFLNILSRLTDVLFSICSVQISVHLNSFIGFLCQSFTSWKDSEALTLSGWCFKGAVHHFRAKPWISHRGAICCQCNPF